MLPWVAGSNPAPAISMKNIRGKTALVTGASRGIGSRIALALADEGMNLVLSARTVAAIADTATEARSRGVDVTCLAAELSDRRQVESLARRAEAESGGIGVLVNNAAIEHACSYDRVPPEAITDIIDVNLTAPLLLVRLLLPEMIRRGEGHVVNLSSLAGMVGTPYQEAYSATKHGLVGFSRSLRLFLEAEGHDVGVSVICPTFVEDDGMYHTANRATGVTAPSLTGTVAIESVTRATVRAILRDEPEVVLSGRPVRPFLAVQAISPRTTDRLASAAGVPKMFKQWATACEAASERQELEP